MKALDVEVLTEQCLDPIFDIKGFYSYFIKISK